MKKALVTGVTGQDGSYLAELLLEKGYEVHGLIRRSSSYNQERLEDLLTEDASVALLNSSNFHLHYSDITDALNITRLVGEIQPDEIYNLAAQSHVRVSFDMPSYTLDVDAKGTLNILEAVRILGLTKKTRVYQASTSELFGGLDYNRPEIGYNEESAFHPRSPYGAAKIYGYWITRNYRESYDMFAVNGILFNHESERRGETFVTRKISLGVARIAQGKQRRLTMGNLDALRDWGYAKDYVECMWMILQHDKPEDFVIATGVTHTVREFIELAFGHVGIEIEWQGEGVDEIGVNKATGDVVVDINPKFFRPAEVDLLLGDPSKSRDVLGWNPTKTSFEELVRIMVEADMDKVGKEGRVKVMFD